MPNVWAEGTCQRSPTIKGLSAEPVFGGIQRMPYIEKRSANVYLQRHATTEMAAQFHHLFVNRRAYTLQSMRPHPETGRHYYFRPKAQEGQPPTALGLA